MAKTKATKKKATKAATKSVKKATTKKAASTPTKKSGAKATKKTAAKKTAPKKAAKSGNKVASKATSGGPSIEDIKAALANVIATKESIGTFDGKTEAEIDAYFAKVDAARVQAWGMLEKAIPQFVEQLVYAEMLECFYTDENAGSIRYIASELGWDEEVGQFVLVGQTGDVWEGSGKLYELVSPLDTDDSED